MYEKLVSFAAKQLELDATEITPDTTFESLGIDSLDTVEMVMDLEDDLGIELEVEEKIATFGELAEFIDSKLNQFAKSNSLVMAYWLITRSH